MVRTQSNVQTRFWGFVLYSKLWRLPPPAFVASSPPSSRPQAVSGSPSHVEVAPAGYESLFTRICYIFARIAKIFADPFFSKFLNDCYWSFILTCFYFTSFLVFAENVKWQAFFVTFLTLFILTNNCWFFRFCKMFILKTTYRSDSERNPIISLCIEVYAFGIFNLVLVHSNFAVH